MRKKLLLAGIMAAVMAMGSVPALAAVHSQAGSAVREMGQSADTRHQGQPQMQRGEQSQSPQAQKGEQPPEPPKDENGNPLPPPDGKNMEGQGQNSPNHDGKQPPEPPKDKDGKPVPPPDGFQHGQDNQQRAK